MRADQRTHLYRQARFFQDLASQGLFHSLLSLYPASWEVPSRSRVRAIARPTEDEVPVIVAYQRVDSHKERRGTVQSPSLPLKLDKFAAGILLKMPSTSLASSISWP